MISFLTFVSAVRAFEVKGLPGLGLIVIREQIAQLFRSMKNHL